ncbi:MAG TPA: ABC transporter ATP-binding protein [Patescibacteria group bacterium]|nr:ABC transporter ATP-binding protein [Patescibacteria group bacterium]
MKIKFTDKISDFKLGLNTSTRLLKLIWGYDKTIVIGSAIATIIPTIVPFVNAYIYALIIDLIVKSVGKPFNFSSLFVLLIFRFGTLIAQNLASALQGYMDQITWVKIPVFLYQTILTRLTNLDVEYFEDNKFRDMLQKVREGYVWMPLNLYSNIFYTLGSILQMVISFVALATLNIPLATGIIIAAIPAFINQLHYSKVLWGVWSENSPYRKKFWYLSELIQNKEGIKELKIFGTGNKFLTELINIQKRFAKENLIVGRKRLKTSFILNAAGSALYIIIEGFIALITIMGKITLGSLSYYTFVVFNFQGGVSSFFSNVGRVFDQSLYVKDIFSVMDLPQKMILSENPIKIDPDKPPKIEFNNITFTYPEAKKPTLKNFSLTIEPGEKVAFVGENGAGKTTLIKLLARFYDVSEGEILINGHNIKDIDLASWYKMLGVIFQDFIKYEYTLGENIHFGKIHEDFDLEKVKQAAKMSGTDKIAEKLEKGYDQVLGLTFEGGAELSLGQWQKVALARAFLRDAPILILDEPTASIDAKAEKEIFDKVEKLERNKTVIVISHRFSTVRNADKIFVIENGKIAEFGNHKTLLSKKGIYAKLFNLQAEKYK